MTIKLANQDISTAIQHVSIRLSVGGHSQFSVTFSNEDRAAHFRGTLADSSKKWIGKNLEIDGLFKGVVTSVSLSRTRTGGSDFVLHGQSPTILLDDGIHVRSFGEKNLKQIFDAVLQPYQSKLDKVECTPQYRDKIKYGVQYRESNFGFINRLAARYGEWFYYDGQSLIFGKRTEGSPIRLNFERDLVHFNIAMKTVPVNFKLRAYDYKGHEFPVKMPNYGALENEYAQIALDKSKQDLFPQTTEIPIHLSMGEKDLAQIATLRQNAHLNELVVVSGVSTCQELRLGSTIEIVDPRSNLSAGGNDAYGKYIITHLTHEISRHGEAYTNHFEAIPKDASIPPLSIAPDPPPCEMQIAEVVANDDPDALGRVRVQFIWQKDAKGDDAKTNWIRVASQSGGGDKGFYLLPEKGDQVMVAFEHGHPERPYVLTAMYHGKAKPEHHDKNNLKKALKTKGGHQILMNDEKGKESMALSSPTDFSAAATAGNLDLTARAAIAISSENGTIKITSGGGDIIIDTPANVKIHAAKIDIDADGSISLSAKSSIELNAPKIDVNADATLTANSAKVTVDGKMTSVSGTGMLTLESNGVTSVSGTILKLN